MNHAAIYLTITNNYYEFNYHENFVSFLSYLYSCELKNDIICGGKNVKRTTNCPFI